MSDDKRPWESKKFIMVAFAFTLVVTLQIAGNPLEPTVASTLLLVAGGYAGAQTYLDKER